jgi:uncharacterized RDD family membrane protein YckC
MEAKPSNLQETLAQAENAHWLDCPNCNWGLRLASIFLDSIFIYLILHAIDRLFLAISIHETALQIQSQPFPISVVEYFLKAGFLFLYLVFSVSVWGSTLGKRLLGIRIVDANSGANLSIPRVLICLAWFFATHIVSIGVGIFRPDHRAFHDLTTNSLVKKVRGRQ